MDAGGNRTRFEIRPHGAFGSWESNDRRYRKYAHDVLAEHERLCREVVDNWPGDPTKPLNQNNAPPELWRKAKERDRTADVVQIYCAMAVEGYLNFYGVLRLGQRIFDEHFERLSLVPKLQRTLMFCDHVVLETNDQLLILLRRISERRNGLVHPKTREVGSDPSSFEPTSRTLPDVAQSAVADMESFFSEFLKSVPEASNHLSEMPDA
jgi:hypothetical protein